MRRAMAIVVMIAVLAMAGAAQADLVHLWTFDDGTANDSIGTAHGALSGGASISGGRLDIPGAGKMLTGAIGSSISTKTLVSWTSLRDVTNRTRGSALTLENNAAGAVFDGIVYAEAIAQHWMAGSDGFQRTQFPQTYGSAETVADPGEVMMAISYAADNSISVYRNDALYGNYSKGGLVTYGGGSVVQIGPRHGSHTDIYNGYVNEARIYNTALGLTEIQAVYAAGPATYVPPPPTQGPLFTFDSFETPPCGTNWELEPAGWTQGVYGAGLLTNAAPWDNPNPTDGVQCVWINTNVVGGPPIDRQVVEAGGYDFGEISLLIDIRNTDGSSNDASTFAQVGFMQGGSWVGTIISFPLSGLPNQGPFQLDFEASVLTSELDINQDLYVRLDMNGPTSPNNQVNYDRLRITTESFIPEPAGLGLVGLALLAVRRKRS